MIRPSLAPTLRDALRLACLVTLLGAGLASPARGQTLRTLATDDGGVTLRLDLPEWRLVPAPGSTNRVRIDLPGLGETEEPGRPLLPLASTLVALPPGARASVTVVAADEETVTENVALVIAGRPAWVRDERLGTQPAIEEVAAILDGAWPRAEVEIGEPFALRRQSLVAVRVLPFRYDEASGRLWARRSITVRVSFSGGRRALGLAAAPGAVDAVLRGALANPGQAEAFRTESRPVERALFARPPADVAAPAGTQVFDEDFPEVRVRIDTTGVYALAFDDLVVHGFPAGVPVGQVSVHRHEYVPGVSPPYVTIESACEVNDYNTNGVFDEGDVVFVYAQSFADRARPSRWQRQWGDSDYLYVTRLDSRPALRVGTRPGWRNALGLTPLASYPFTRMHERTTSDPKNFLRFLPDTTTDPWVWTPLVLYYDRPDTMRFTVDDIDTTRRVTFAVTYQGSQTTDHWVWAGVRNALGQRSTVVDSAFFTGKATVRFVGTATGSALTEGLNGFTVWGKTLPGPPDPVTNFRTFAPLNRFETTHWRAFRAIRGVLACNSAEAAGVFQVRAGRFPSAAIQVWDVTDSVNVTRLDVDPSRITQVGGSWQVEFQDSTGSAAERRRYVVFDFPRIVDPSAYAPVTRARLTERADRPDYVIIAPDAFVPATAPLAAKREAQGLTVAVVPYEALKNEFNGGRSSAYAIRRFVTHAYRDWDTRFVVLLGDAAAEDPQHLWPTSMTDWLPTMTARSPIAVTIGGEVAFETIPTDSWYGWCVDPGCTDPSLQPKLHDLYVGRLPVNSLQQAQEVVAKLVAYENVTPDQTWRRQMVLHADDQFSGETFGDFATTTYCLQGAELRFVTLNDACRDVILNQAGLALSEPEIFDMGVWLADEPTVITNGRTCRPDRTATQTRTRATVTPALFSRLSAGRLWWNYQGHANEHLLSHENIYYTRGPADDWRTLANDGKPFLFSAFSCHANHFGRVWEGIPADGPCVGEELVVAPSKGAIASWASSGFEIIPSSTTQHINVELARALFSMPPPDTVIDMRGDRNVRVVLGEAVALALLRWYPRVIFNSFERDVGLTYELLGDPATRISIGKPQSFVTANGNAVTEGQPVRLHTPGDTLTLVADLVSNTAITAMRIERTVAGVTDTLDSGEYSITPAFPDTAYSVGGTDGRRYALRHHASLLAQPYRYTFHATDRVGVTASFTVDLPFTTVLRAGGQPVNDGDAVPPGATLTMLVLSPAPILDPMTELALSIDGAAQPFQAVQNPGDPSRREWLLTWEGPSAIGSYEARLTVNATATANTHRFAVTVAGTELRLADAMLFPNPFEDDLGAAFSFNLESGRDADVLIRVYTVSGRLVYRRFERGLAPGYHQLAWDGRDAEGDKLANGVYFYRLQATNGSAEVTHEGRIVKLRKPRREAEPVVTP